VALAPLGKSANDGAPGVEGVTFAAIQAQGVDAFLGQIRDELVRRFPFLRAKTVQRCAPGVVSIGFSKDDQQQINTKHPANGSAGA
jgi:hypothetical protein